ncbi:hypothetical protein JCM1841_001278 [Sporobolomyces salmonicolor]
MPPLSDRLVPSSTLRSRTPSAPSSPGLDAAPLLVHTASSSSISGDAAFSAVLPLAPLRPPHLDSVADEPHSSSSSRPAPPSLRDLLRTFATQVRRRRRFLALFLGFLALFLLALHLTRDLVLLLRFKLVDHAYSEGWGWPLVQRDCGLRKRPMVFVRGEGEAVVVWEVGRCNARDEEWGLRWGVQGPQKSWGRRAQVEKWETAKLDGSVMEASETTGQAVRTVYSAPLSDLRGGQVYTYEVTLSSISRARHSFPWLGPTRSSSRRPPETLNIACVADNQFNLRTFHRLLMRLVRSSRSLSFRHAPPAFPRERPHLVLHAGDNVQNPHNLAQWQTDFWDPLTSRTLPFPLGSEVPVLLARGNHDWDETGRNEYVGGLPSRTEWEQHLGFASSPDAEAAKAEGRRGTYYAFSPHARVRFLVLDSNLPTLEEQKAQEEWLEWELGRGSWKGASLRVAVVHTPPWIEWWDARAWKEGGEWAWSLYVRERLVPLLVASHCSLVLSGHSHAYSRGFLPASLLRPYTSAVDAVNSTTLPPLARAAALERSWTKTARARREGVIEHSGIVSIVFGGAGGTLDTERVEDWGVFEGGKWSERRGKHHSGWMVLHLAGDDGAQPYDAVLREREKTGWEKRGEWVYEMDAGEGCDARKQVTDVLEWRVVDEDGAERDRMWIRGKGCLHV